MGTFYSTSEFDMRAKHGSFASDFPFLIFGFSSSIFILLEVAMIKPLSTKLNFYESTNLLPGTFEYLMHHISRMICHLVTLRIEF